MFTGKLEEEFLLQYINDKQNVLEYGSGESTKQIAARVKKLVSVEHNKEWYDKIKSQLPDNTTYLFHPPHKTWDKMSDGGYDQFLSYITCTAGLGPFDIVIIDGRAREHCCKFIFENESHEDTIYFIHDFIYPNPPPDRAGYLNCLEYLDIINNVDSMYMFKKKI